MATKNGGKGKVCASAARSRGFFVRNVARRRPGSREELGAWVENRLGVVVPDRAVCAGHNSPMDYLWHAFGGDFTPVERTGGDCVVWANRGGGKTRLAAIATLLDCWFKADCQVRILGGSLEQSSRVYAEFAEFVREGFEKGLVGRMNKGGCQFVNGSAVRILPQSDRGVRGVHVHKLRCDEVELFDPGVWAAAQFCTHSKGGIAAAVEAASTLHEPAGLMQRVLDRARGAGTPVFRWCLWETIERCVDRSCSRCALDAYCQGKAKQSRGYIRIDDAIAQMRRSSRADFESEALCLRPSRRSAVFEEFDPEVHVAVTPYDANLPTYRAIDFGFVNPFVCLWIQVDREGAVRVIDEYVRRKATVAVHAEEIRRRTPTGANVAGTFCDPSGAGRNDITGTSPVQELAEMGIPTRHRASAILDGIARIRAFVRSGDGRIRLRINPRCERLIEAMQCYHFPEAGRGATSETPEKDGVHDHPIDALRYFFVNWGREGKEKIRGY